jgi:bifunctional NMN adenylyltransferase/nudix hydrolase
MTGTETVDVAVVIGRFQFVHVAHVALLRQALALAGRCVVVIGSAFQARTPRNPLSWVERREMILLALPPAERVRVDFIPVRDCYDQQRWQRLVIGEVEALAAQRLRRPHATIALVGHFKDATSDYLRGFTGWSFVAAPAHEGVGSTAIRDAVFGTDAQGSEAALGAMSSMLAPGGADFLRAWLQLPCVDTLRAEWAALRRDRQAWANAPYPPVFVTVDAVVRCAGHVLLIVRDRHPGLGLNALPGGFLEQRETLYQSAVRELAEETNLKLLDATLRGCLRDVAVFDDPNRSLRGRVITHAFCFDLGERELPEVVGGDDAASARWVPIDALPTMEDSFHDDHFHILDHFLGLTTDLTSRPVDDVQ